MTTELSEIARFAADVARRAGRRLSELRSRGGLVVATKDEGRELVTSADVASNEIVADAVRKAMPGAQYLSEEEEQRAIDWRKPTWVVDPLDGTVNYVHGHAHVAVSLAYVVDGRVQVGVVHAPFADETFVAVRGGGATRNSTSLGPPPDMALADALISTGFPHDRRDLEAILRRLARVVRRCNDVRRLGSPSLDICWVAAGRLHAAYETLRPWDVAAAGLVARELGVMSAHYGPIADDALPPELRGDDVAFARPALLTELMTVLEGEPDAGYRR